MKKLDRILLEVAQKIRPTESDREREKAMIDRAMGMLASIIKSEGVRAEPLLVGSIAKDTDLRDNKDLDIFLQFDKGVPREELEALGLAIGRRFFEALHAAGEVTYAEHPYIKGNYKEFIIEVVPCYKMCEGGTIISAVDRSPLHMEFVIQRLNKKKSLRDEIRLLKQFMRANNLYGAHAAVEGFSGYLCELLVIKFGSFLDVLEKTVNWKKYEFITMRGGSRKKFAEAPLVFIDPVDPERNVAAAVSVEKMAMFSHLAREFLSSPDERYFHMPKVRAMGRREFFHKLKSRQTDLLAIRFKVPKLVEDTLVPQLGKSLSALAKECEHRGFRILKNDYWTNGEEAVFVFEFEVWMLPRVQKKEGPFFDSKVEDIKGFFGKNSVIAMSKPYIKGDRWFIDVKRGDLDAIDFVRKFLKNPLGFGKNLRDTKDFKVYSNGSLTQIKDHRFWEFMNGFW
jgi:tRNA nucleotidyltransferase (CCA-adding enzyme)